METKNIGKLQQTQPVRKSTSFWMHEVLFSPDFHRKLGKTSEAVKRSTYRVISMITIFRASQFWAAKNVCSTNNTANKRANENNGNLDFKRKLTTKILQNTGRC